MWLCTQQNSRDTVPNLHYNNIEAFVQDDWKVSSQTDAEPGAALELFPFADRCERYTLNNFDPTVFDPE